MGRKSDWLIGRTEEPCKTCNGSGSRARALQERPRLRLLTSRNERKRPPGAQGKPPGGLDHERTVTV